jgi:hypothetical protein
MRRTTTRPVFALLLALSLALTLPAAALAQEEEARDYVSCMDAAVEQLFDCVRVADETEVLCWSRYGYAKLGCTLKYLWDSRRKREA